MLSYYSSVLPHPAIPPYYCKTQHCVEPGRPMILNMLRAWFYHGACECKDNKNSPRELIGATQIRPKGGPKAPDTSNRPQTSGHSTPRHAQKGKKRPQATPKRPQERSQRQMKNRRCDDDAQSRKLIDVPYRIIGFISDNMIFSLKLPN